MFKNLRSLRNIQAELENKQKELEKITNEITSAEVKLKEVNTNFSLTEKELIKCKAELGTTHGMIEMQELGIPYNPETLERSEIAQKRLSIQEEIGKMIGNKSHIKILQSYLVAGSASKGNQLQKTFSDSIIIGFNAYFNKKLKAVTETNFHTTLDLLDKKFKAYNSKAFYMSLELNQDYLSLCKDLLKCELEDKIAKTKEKERIKQERRMLREQEQLIAEAEKERKKLELERANLQKLFAKAVTEQEQVEIQNKLAEIDKRTEEVDWRVSHYSAGWLYITTTPAMPGIYKCGCTKQLNPLNRLAQLSSASVPFPFECRGLVFSEDVFALEAKMHNRLDSKRVNKDNKLKEFFFGEPDEAIKILTDEFHEEVRFIDEQWIDNGKDNDNETD